MLFIISLIFLLNSCCLFVYLLFFFRAAFSMIFYLSFVVHYFSTAFNLLMFCYALYSFPYFVFNSYFLFVSLLVFFSFAFSDILPLLVVHLSLATFNPHMFCYALYCFPYFMFDSCYLVFLRLFIVLVFFPLAFSVIFYLFFVVRPFSAAFNRLLFCYVFYSFPSLMFNSYFLFVSVSPLLFFPSAFSVIFYLYVLSTFQQHLILPCFAMLFINVGISCLSESFSSSSSFH